MDTSRLSHLVSHGELFLSTRFELTFQELFSKGIYNSLICFRILTALWSDTCLVSFHGKQPFLGPSGFIFNSSQHADIFQPLFFFLHCPTGQYSVISALLSVGHCFLQASNSHFNNEFAWSPGVPALGNALRSTKNVKEFLLIPSYILDQSYPKPNPRGFHLAFSSIYYPMLVLSFFLSYSYHAWF